MFRQINHALSKLSATSAVGAILKAGQRTSIVGQYKVRGVDIKVFIPINCIGHWNHSIHWESREPEELDWIDSMTPSHTLFDVGSNFGQESLYASLKMNGPQEIHAFEPSFLENFIFAYNIAINNIQNVKHIPMAVSDSYGFTQLLWHTNYSRVPSRPERDILESNIPTISLDEYAAKSGAMPTHCKIDVDGGEEKVLLGMSDIMRSGALQSIFIEVQPSTKNQCFKIMEKHGFALRLSSEARGSLLCTNHVFEKQ